MTDTVRIPTHAPTYVKGLDFLLRGGIPSGRVTLVVGGPGSGKTILGSEFVVGGARNGEAGVLVSFDAPIPRLQADIASAGLDAEGLLREGLLAFHHIAWDAAEFPASGAFTLDGLLIQLETMLDGVGGARRLTLDSMEAVLAAADSHHTLRRELRRLFDWLADRGVTTLITAEQGRDQLTRHGLQEYLSDCVIRLEYDVEERLATRRLQVVKRRGGSHSADRHPFLITDQGIRLFPLSASNLNHGAPSETVATGVSGLDAMLGHGGYLKGSSVLVSGTPGAGKSSLAAAFVEAACRRGETALYYAFEESPKQVIRNMASVGYDLQEWVDRGRLHIHSRRPSEHGLEAHLVDMHRSVETLAPDVVVLDPFTSLTSMNFQGTGRSMMIRLVDLLKSCGITALYTSLVSAKPGRTVLRTEGLISSLMDTWLVLESRRKAGRLSRYLWVLKSRGMEHSREIHRLTVGASGLDVEPRDGSEWPPNS